MSVDTQIKVSAKEMIDNFPVAAKGMTVQAEDTKLGRVTAIVLFESGFDSTTKVAQQFKMKALKFLHENAELVARASECVE